MVVIVLRNEILYSTRTAMAVFKCSISSKCPVASEMKNEVEKHNTHYAEPM
jgi:hypothetical protein